MSPTYTKLMFHIVFSTHLRKPLLHAPLLQETHKYIGGVIKGERGRPINIGGVEDHVHLLVQMPPNNNISDLVRAVKSNSSRWLHEEQGLSDFAWQDGYAAFSVSESACD